MSTTKDAPKNIRKVSKSPDLLGEKPSTGRSPTPFLQGNSGQVIQYWGLPIFQKNDSTQIIQSLKVDEEIYQIFPGESHAFLTSKKNNFYAFGNNEFGQLGLNQTGGAQTPILFELKSKHQISKIATSSDFVFIITSKAEVYSWGSNLKGQLGLGHYDSIGVPTKVRSFTPNVSSASGQVPDVVSQSLLNTYEFVVNMACGALHSIALTNTGRVFSCGFGETFALGLGTIKTTPNFEEITYFKDQSLKIGKIAAGTCHSGCLVNNQVYLWGTCGNSKQMQFKKPVLVEGEFDAVNFVLGDFLTVLLSSKGDVFTFGDNIDGQMANALQSNVIPKRVNLPYKTDYIDCGLNHVIALSKHKIFSWGSNRRGQIHPRSSQPFFDSPIELEWITDSMPFAIHCGPQQTYLISKKPILLPEKMVSEIDTSNLMKKEIEVYKNKVLILKKENEKLKEEIKQIFSNINAFDVKSDSVPVRSLDSNEEIMRKFKSELKMNRTLRPVFEIEFKELKIVSKISEGAFGIIYKAKWREITVAVKTLKQEYMKEETIKDFLSELNR